MRRMGIHLKGDERILGDGGFVESVLKEQNEQLGQRYRLQAEGYDFDNVVDRVVKLFDMRPEEILSPGKQRERVRARGLVCYWAVKELGMSGTTVAKLLGIIQSSVSRAVERGEKYALNNGLRLIDEGIA